MAFVSHSLIWTVSAMLNSPMPVQDLEVEKGLDDSSKPESPLSPTPTTSSLIFSYYKENTGRLIIDPKEAEAEFDSELALQLKLSKDGNVILWPQPSNNPNDPQNWSSRRKAIQLMIVTLASITPDFDIAIGVASIFSLANQFDTTTGVINNTSANWGIFAIGIGGLLAIPLMQRLGRLPILFWSQLLALGFLIGCTFAPNVKVFTSMRIFSAFFATTPQVTGLYVVTDMYPFHLQARKINIWSMGFVISPFLSPFLFGFLVARASWRWAYGIGAIYGAIVVLLIVFFGEETFFDREAQFSSKPPQKYLYNHFERLIGIMGVKTRHLRSSWYEVTKPLLLVAYRPHLMCMLIFEGILFGFGIGINVTNAVLLGEPQPNGYGFSLDAIAGSYGIPIVGIAAGELIGRYLNDFIANISIKRNKGVFEAEARLWMCYLTVPLYVIGFVLLGAAFEWKNSLASLILGWGLAQMAIMMNTIAIYAYASDCFPRHRGEISALLNLFRTLGGFSVSYFQVPWANERGALQVFGVEAAIVASLFVLLVPLLQLKGRYFRMKYSL